MTHQPPGEQQCAISDADRLQEAQEDQLAYLAQNIEDAFQEKRKILVVFFDLSN